MRIQLTNAGKIFCGVLAAAALRCFSSIATKMETNGIVTGSAAMKMKTSRATKGATNNIGIANIRYVPLNNLFISPARPKMPMQSAGHCIAGLGQP